ncbi:MAG: hypothetical protein JSV86_05930 [Gemmatimonadota bacterium]|nr:MAG: hypothetical protein JSV86_05930 [Gemmatimonadota bacterium]
MRVRGRKGLSQFSVARAAGLGAIPANYAGSQTMTRLAVISVRRPTGANVHPIWRQLDVPGFLGWNLQLSAGTVQAQIGNGAALTTGGGAIVLPLGRLVTIAFVFDGATIETYVNGAADTSTPAAVVLNAAANAFVGMDIFPAPTLVASPCWIFDLLGSDTVAASAVQMLTAHGVIRDRIANGQSLQGVLPGQDRTWESPDIYETFDATTGAPTWVDADNGDVYSSSDGLRVAPIQISGDLMT